MKISKFIVCTFFAMMFVACSQEEEKLPELAHIEAPKEISGTYVGRIPTESAKAHQIRAVLDSLGGAVVTHSVLRDSLETYNDTLKYALNGEVLTFSFKDKTWNFKKNGDFGYVFLNPQGEPYVDAAGSNFALLRILQKVEVK